MRSDSAPIARYDSVAMTLHWATVVFVAFLAPLGLLFDKIPRDARGFWINIHVTVGLLFFALILMRLLWRIGHRPPSLPADADALSRRVSNPFHGLMYVVILVITTLGVVARVWHGRTFDFGLFTLDFGVASNRAVFPRAEQYHLYAVYTLLGLISLHILAALWHQFIRRDSVMLRMTPRPRA